MKREMKRVAVVSGVSFALLAGTAGVARAQMPPPSPPPAGVAPAPEAQPATAQPPTPPGMVRLYFHTYRDKGSARVYSRQADGRYGFVCATPCTADVPANTPLRVTYNDKEEDPKDFDSGSHIGEEMAVEIKGPSAGPVIGGSIMMGVGTVAIISGIIVVAAADDLGKGSAILDDGYYRTLGYITIGIGVGVAVAGIIWFATRSSEPRIDAYPYGSHHPDDRDRRRRRSKTETFLEDAAMAKPRDPLAVPAAAAPLSWSFAF